MSIRDGLLALLADEPKHGYQLKSEFEARTGGVWPLNVGQVYTTLDRLGRDGLVVAGEPDADGRRPYSLTDAGRVELAGWFATPTGTDPPARDELVIKVLVAVRAEGVDAGAVVDAQRAGLLASLQRHRAARRRLLADPAATDASPETAAPGPDTDPDELTSALLFDALVARLESDLRWLDLVEERLRTTGGGRRSPATTGRTRR